MNEALREAFRHNSWANRRLLEACRELTDEQLNAGAVGSYGSVKSTLNHIVDGEAGYARRLANHGPLWPDADVDLSELASRLDEIDAVWEEVLAAPIDTERIIVVDRGANEVRAGVYVAQALHHGNSHREQVCAILTSLGLEAPDLQAWAYAWATGRIWPNQQTS